MKVYKPRVKVCGIRNTAEAKMAIGSGADSIGVVSSTPENPEVNHPDTIRGITQMIPPSIDTFVLSALENSWDLIDLIRNVKNRTIQLGQKITSGNYLEIRASIPCVKIVQTINADHDEALDMALQIDSYVDAILIKCPHHDKWPLCREIVEYVETPVFLSGDLNPENVADAVKAVKPFGLDVNHGVRNAEGRLDRELVRGLLNVVKGVR